MVTNWVVGVNGEIDIGTVETRRSTSPVRAVLVPKVAVESECGSVGATRERLGGARAAPLTSMPSTIFSLRALFTGLFLLPTIAIVSCHRPAIASVVSAACCRTVASAAELCAVPSSTERCVDCCVDAKCAHQHDNLRDTAHAGWKGSAEQGIAV